MKRRMLVVAALTLALASLASTTGAALAQGSQARVRVVHASPDAPPVDVLVDGNRAFAGVAFKGITPYASLAAGAYRVRVVPAGTNQPVVIDTTLELQGGTDYTVVALGKLANIQALPLVDNNTPPPQGQAKVRFVHASPDAPAVDVAVRGGPVLFSNVAFKGVGDYAAVPAGTYDLEVRPAGTDNVVLSVPGVTLSASTVYTVFAVGLVNGQPPLQALISVDAGPSVLPETGGPGPISPTLIPCTLALAGALGGLTAALRRWLA